MSDVLVCTAAYEAGRPYLPHYAAGLLRAAADRDVGVLFAIDDLADPAEAFAPLARRMETQFVGAPPGATPAVVRATMLEAARRSAARTIVLVDFDDVPAPDLVERHCAALQRAEISYGDLRIIGADGRVANPSFFAGAGVPYQVESSDDIVLRNFLGFSNVALRRDAIGAAPEAPPHLVAADWWCFTKLIDAGAKASRADGVVAEYRLHSANVLGGKPDPALPAVLRRARMMREHYAALPQTPLRAEADRKISILLALATRDPTRIGQLAEAACAAPGVWFDDVARLADRALGEPA